MNPTLAKRVHTVAAALGDASEAGATCVVRTTHTNPGNGVLVCGPSAAAVNCTRERQGGRLSECEVVPLLTLDDVLTQPAVAALLAPAQRVGTELPSSGGSRPQRFDVMKMDVEGHECHVLRGGASLFDHYRPRLLHVEAKPPVERCLRN
jgi:hypothetical protein